MNFSTYIVLIIAWISYASASDHDAAERLQGVIASIDPEYGPRSGGTKVTLTGRNLHDPHHGDTVTVYLKDGGAVYPCSVVDKSKVDTIVVQTPNYNGTRGTAELELLLAVGYNNGSTKHNLTSTFTYKPDPTVRSIHPDSTIVAGGTTLTVIGVNLDSVQRPLMISSVLSSGQLVKHNDNQQAYFVNSTCIKFHIPRADDVIKASPSFPGDIHEVFVEVGFIFDGLQKGNYPQLQVKSNPIVEKWESRSLPFSYDNDEFITVNVTWPPGLVVSEDDLTIMIGARKCLNLRKNENQLVCEPPSVPEPVILNGPETISKPAVAVRIGYQQTEVGIIIYALPGGLHIIIIIMIVIFAVVFLASLVFGCIAICSGRRKDSKPQHKERSSIAYVPVDDLDEMARRKSRIRLSKDSIVDIPQQYQRTRNNSNTSSTSSPSAGTDKGDQQPLHKIEEHGELGGKAKVVFTDMSKK